MKTRSILKQSPKTRAARRGSRSKDSLPILGITMGDPAGIGPEVIAKAWAMRTVHRLCRPLVIGSVPVMQQTLRWLRLPFAVQPVSEQDLRAPRPGTICVLDPLKRPLGTFPQGRVSEKAGAASVSFILKAVDLAQRGIIDALVTGPINKEAINLAGYHYPGHTELLADLTRSKEVGMMIMGGPLKIMFVTTHVAIRRLPDALNANGIFRAGMLGILLGLFTVAFTGTVLYVTDRLTGGRGVAGVAAASTAGNAAAVPAIVASANPAYADAARFATVLVSASVVVTAILVPLLTAFIARRTNHRSASDGRSTAVFSEIRA